jgi:nucleoside-diphosphate-sugar epimerase
MKRVLVTGGAGFVGRQTLEPLVARGFDVHAVTRSSARPAVAGVTWHTTDLLAPGAAAPLVATVRPTHVLHLAWCLDPGIYLQSVENLGWVRASLEFAEAFAASGGRRWTAAGSCFEYDLRPGYCSERLTPLVPASLYGVAKVAAQTTIAAFCRQAGVSEAWGRIFFLYGPHEHPKRLVADVTRALLAGEPARCSHGRQIRDFLHVGDVAAALVALVDSPVEGAVNVGSGEPVALSDVIGRIGSLIGRPDLIQLGARPAPPDEPPLVVADTRRLRDEVGWTPAYDLTRGLDDTIAWWRAALTGA